MHVNTKSGILGFDLDLLTNFFCASPYRSGNNCYSKKTITHEFVHAFGLYHEQSRSDRDKYVTINWDKVLARHCRNFVKQETSLTFGVPYDGKSLMHYGPRLSSNDGSDTITSKVHKFTKGLEKYLL